MTVLVTVSGFFLMINKRLIHIIYKFKETLRTDNEVTP